MSVRLFLSTCKVINAGVKYSVGFLPDLMLLILGRVVGLIDAGRDGRTCLARPILRREWGQREKFIFPVQLTTSRIGNHTRLMPNLLCVMTIHTYIYTCCYH